MRHNAIHNPTRPPRSHGICTFGVADLMRRARYAIACARMDTGRADAVLHPALCLANGTGEAWRSYFQGVLRSGCNCP
jgi:hypothetical protein